MPAMTSVSAQCSAQIAEESFRWLFNMAPPRTLVIESAAIIGAVVFSSVTTGTITTLRTVCRNCLLFGKVYEAKRILANDNPLWCNFCVVLSILTAVFGGCLLLRLLFRRLRLLKTLLQGGIIACCNMLSLLVAGAITAGFHIWCSSFKINRCIHSDVSDMDWKMFTPKYSSCASSYTLLWHAEKSSWSAFVCWCAALACHLWRQLREKCDAS